MSEGRDLNRDRDTILYQGVIITEIPHGEGNPEGKSCIATNYFRCGDAGYERYSVCVQQGWCPDGLKRPDGEGPRILYNNWLQNPLEFNAIKEIGMALVSRL